MQKAEYPQRSCRMPVAGEHQDYLCELAEHHPGPDASFSVADSVRRRDEWEMANPGWETLTGFDDPFKEIMP
jgi:hypothetical protein